MPRSRVDYATDNITVYRFCNFGCRYCWAWRVPVFIKRIQSGKYDPVEEAKRYLKIKSPRVIVISFTSDPYPIGIEDTRGLTRSVLEILSKARWHKVLVLTKNPVTAVERDMDLFIDNKHFWLGTTVITLDDDKARYWEPGAPSLWERLGALKRLHEVGGNTWLSIEPIIPDTTYPEEIVRKTLDYIDWYVLGAFNYTRILGYTNYTEKALKIWYQEHMIEAIDVLRSHSKPFYIKKELRRYLEELSIGIQ